MRFRTVIILFLLWETLAAHGVLAQQATCNTQAEPTQYRVEYATSVCIEPADLRISVGSEKEKMKFENICKKWSSFIGSSRVFEANQFTTSVIPPVNQFAQTIIKDWMRVELSPPSSQSLYNSPGRFGLVNVRADQPRTHTLVVWKSLKGGPGMIGYVLNELDTKEGADPMAKYQVLYPSHKSEPQGKLAVLDASTLEKFLSADKIDYSVAFLRPSNTVPLYWNQWIQGSISDNVDPPKLTAGTSFSYHLDLSALDFRAFINNSDNTPQIGKQEVKMLIPQLGKFKITVFPIGHFQNRTARTATAEVNNTRLRAPLIRDSVLEHASTTGNASEMYGALYDAHGGSNQKLVFSFLPTEAGCATLVTLITNELEDEVVAAWAQSIKVLPAPSQTAAGTMSSAATECEYHPLSAKLFGMTSAPSFSIEERTLPSARITFLDLEGVTLGFFENLQTQAAPKIWVLESKQGLRKEMAVIKRFVDERITEADKHPLAAGDYDIAKHLKNKLFNCSIQSESECLGMQAYEELMNIAHAALADPNTGGTGSIRVRVRATFRDIKNNIYYLPLHLLRIDGDHRLVDAVRIEQPLPIPFTALNVEGCTSEFAIGLVVQDDESLDEEQWRTKWLERMRGCANHFYSNISELKYDFFRRYDPKINPMGLVLLSHHGGGEIADTDKQTDPDRLINSSDIKRDFGSGSFAILASCSVGAMDEKHQDNSLFLHSLNERHVNAAIVSLFNVPPEVAKPFLDALQQTLLTLNEDTTLFDVFDKSKKKYCESLTNTPLKYLIPKINLFMLVGDGDVKICRYAQ